MDSVNVNLRWTYPSHVSVLKESCISRTSGIYQLFIYEEDKETILLVDSADDSYYESLEKLKRNEWFRIYEKDIFIRIAFILFPIRCNKSTLADIKNSLVNIYKPKFNAIPNEGFSFSNKIFLNIRQYNVNKYDEQTSDGLQITG